MISLPSNTNIWIAAGFTDMRCGFDGLAAKVQTVLQKDPFSGHVFVFRGKRGDLLSVFTGEMADYVCSPNGSNEAASPGRELTAESSA